MNVASADDEIDAIADKSNGLKLKMACTGAASIKGLFAKIECLWELSAPSGEDSDLDPAAALLRGIYEDAARLAVEDGP